MIYNQRYETLELVTKWEILSLYANSVLIGFWVFFKWFVSYLWNIVNQSANIGKRQRLESTGTASVNKPPAFLVADSYLGRHSYIKLMVRRGGDLMLGAACGD